MKLEEGMLDLKIPPFPLYERICNYKFIALISNMQFAKICWYLNRLLTFFRIPVNQQRYLAVKIAHKS